jgi:hypothetical protein
MLEYTLLCFTQVGQWDGQHVSTNNNGAGLPATSHWHKGMSLLLLSPLAKANSCKQPADVSLICIESLLAMWFLATSRLC